MIKTEEKWNENVVTCLGCRIQWAKPGEQCPVCYVPIPEMSLEAVVYLKKSINQAKQSAYQSGREEGVQQLKADLPTAWKVMEVTDPTQHNERCSYRQTNRGLLCDCVALVTFIETIRFAKYNLSEKVEEHEKEM